MTKIEFLRVVKDEILVPGTKLRILEDFQGLKKDEKVEFFAHVEVATDPTTIAVRVASGKYYFINAENFELWSE